MNYWIISTFTYGENDFEFDKLSSYFSKKAWGIEAGKTDYPIKKGDKVLAYIGGKNAKIFIFVATIANERFYRMPKKFRNGKQYNPFTAGMEYYLKLKNIALFKKPLSIYGILNKISFIKSPIALGMAMSQTMKKITKQQFDKILDDASK